MMATLECDSADLVGGAISTLTMANKTNFAQVVFHGIEESYTIGANVECRYTITSGLETTARDWVGLYRVGWRNMSDYVYYDWAPQQQKDVNADPTSVILFPANRLPTKDDGEFYQFCYVTSAGHVRGASTPFQFKLVQSSEELIEIEDENGELLIIRTKTAVLEDQLKKANETRMILKQEIQILENEKDIMRRAEIELQKKLCRQKEITDSADAKIKEMMEMITDGNYQRDHLQDCITSLQEKLEVINQEKLSMEKRLDDSDRYIASVQEKIKVLVNEKDALTGRIKSLEEEKELYKEQLMSTESAVQSSIQDCEKVKTDLIDEKMCTARIKKDFNRLESELIEQRQRLEHQMKESRGDKENLEYLSERLRNAEDKLSAAEHCKTMLNEEVLTLKQAYEKIAADLESCRESADRMKESEASTSAKLLSQIELMRTEITGLENQLSAKDEESSILSSDVTRLRGELEAKQEEVKVEANGPLYALQTALDTLKGRYERLVKKNEQLQKSWDDALAHIRDLSEADGDQRQEIRSLRERLLMGQEAYKDKFIECDRLESEIRRLSRSRSESGQSYHDTTAASSFFKKTGSFCERDTLHKSDVTSQTSPAILDAASRPSTELMAEALSGTEVQQQLCALETELESRKQSSRKYKRLYQQHAERLEEAHTELELKDRELAQLRQMITEMRNVQSLNSLEERQNVANAGVQTTLSSDVTEKVKDFDAMTRCDSSNLMLAAPLKPLPPPILPKRLHSYTGSDELLKPIVNPPFIPERVRPTPHGVGEAGTHGDGVALNRMTRVMDSSNDQAPPSAHQIQSQTGTTASVTSRICSVEPLAAAAAAAAGCCTVTTTTVTAASFVSGVATTTSSAAAAASAFEEERFEDAQADLQDIAMICPVCTESFSTNNFTEEEFTRHVNSHFGPESFSSPAGSDAWGEEVCCPMCTVLASNLVPETTMEQHVNSHFA